MITWHSDKLIIKRKQLNDLPTVEPLATAVDFLRKDVFVQKLWDRMCKDGNVAVEKLAVEFFTFALELCPKAFLETREIRLHLHAVLEFPHQKSIREKSSLSIDGVWPLSCSRCSGVRFI